MRKHALLLLLLLSAGCLRGLPQGRSQPDLPALAVVGNNPLNVTLGPKGREALIGELTMSPEGFGIDVMRFMPEVAGLSSGVVWCAEPVGYSDDGGLIVNMGMTWWPPGAEPNFPTRSITEALMRCLGFLDSKPWARAVIVLKPASLPEVNHGGVLPLLAEGTDTLAAALEQAFLFGVSAPLQARGLALMAGTQDGSQQLSDRGLKKSVEAHVKHTGGEWSMSNRIDYSPAEDADAMNVLLGKAKTTVEGVSYILANGTVEHLLPSAISRAALRIRAGFGTNAVTISAKVRAERSPGLTCVLRTLSPPIVAPGQEAPRYPGVNLEEAQKCVLTDEDQSGPKRKLK